MRQLVRTISYLPQNQLEHQYSIHTIYNATFYPPSPAAYYWTSHSQTKITTPPNCILFLKQTSECVNAAKVHCVLLKALPPVCMKLYSWFIPISTLKIFERDI